MEAFYNPPLTHHRTAPPLPTPSLQDDLHTLSLTLTILLKLASHHLGHKAHLALTTHPYWPSLNYFAREPLWRDAGFVNLESYRYLAQMEELSSVFVSKGDGLCEHWDDSKQCEREDYAVRRVSVLVVSMSEMGLGLVSSSVGHEGTLSYYTKRNRFVELGMRYHESNPGDVHFWWRVREEMIAHIRESPFGIPKRVFLLGDHVLNEQFRGAVIDALTAVGGWYLVEQVRNMAYDPVFEPTRGAALLTQRWQKMAFNCLEPRGCEEKRDEATKTKPWTVEGYREAAAVWKESVWKPGKRIGDDIKGWKKTGAFF